jgi:hypothetical protein
MTINANAKSAKRIVLANLIAAYLANGGKITVCPPRRRR